ncbi:type II/IV secretion system protein [Patescibacteria group bacterium]|nr:MAG: type II/IV secretion system protein [Patescibacteria group bacterium]
MVVEFNEEKQEKKIADLRKREEEELARALSAKYGVSYLDLSAVPINIGALRTVPEAEARAANIAPFNIVNKNIDVAVLSPEHPKTLEALESLRQKGYNPTPYMVSHESLSKVWGRYKDLSFSFETRSGAIDISNEEIVELLKHVTSLSAIRAKIEEVLAQTAGFRISRILEIIIAGALSVNSSDVHFEPEEDDVRLRYRLDGVLTDILRFDQETYRFLLSRVKLVSNLKLNITGAQDGRFTIKLPEVEIEIRTSILPGAYNETIVLRILNPSAISVPLEKLGIHLLLLEILQREIAKPTGMILATGPTGSGKTTTLYAFLKKVHKPEIKIITIENPIEYHLPGIVQTQTNPDRGYTFSEGLRSALRQDPDIIMVGEIRDAETAEIAVNAALTGHLVFSTLHTNDAAGSFPRLIDLGVNPKIITSAINVSIAQRLVRRLCPDCKQKVSPSAVEKKLINETLESIRDRRYLEGVEQEFVWKADGCERCQMTGYKGRIGIFEAILTDEAVEAVVRENPSEREVKRAAAPQNILDLRQDGILKVLSGTTSLEELGRVVDLGAKLS